MTESTNNNTISTGSVNNSNNNSTAPGTKTGPKQPSRMKTDCKQEQAEALHCSINHYETKDTVCQVYFTAYKECRKIEHAYILEQRQKEQQERLAAAAAANSENSVLSAVRKFFS